MRLGRGEGLVEGHPASGSTDCRARRGSASARRGRSWLSSKHTTGRWASGVVELGTHHVSRRYFQVTPPSVHQMIRRPRAGRPDPTPTVRRRSIALAHRPPIPATSHSANGQILCAELLASSTIKFGLKIKGSRPTIAGIEEWVRRAQAVPHGVARLPNQSCSAGVNCMLKGRGSVISYFLHLLLCDLDEAIHER